MFTPLKISPSGFPVFHKNATLIQRVWRGYVIRQIGHTSEGRLSYALLKRALPYLTGKASSSKQYGYQLGGDGIVSFPTPDIVLKHVKNTDSRLNQMRNIRRFCQEQQYGNLVVPKAHVYHVYKDKDVLIEERLSLPSNILSMLGSYYENREAFTPAIEQLTKLCCYASVKDIKACGGEPILADLCGIFGRYDNLPLYTSTKGPHKSYNIGLIDVEGWEIRESPEVVVDTFQDLALLFPYHLEAILKVGQAFSSDVELLRTSLHSKHQIGLKIIDTFYVQHLAFLRGKGIDSLESKQLIEITLERKGFLIESLKTYLSSSYADRINEWAANGVFTQMLDDVFRFIQTMNSLSERNMTRKATLNHSEEDLAFFYKTAQKLEKGLSDEGEKLLITMRDFLLKEMIGHEVFYFEKGFFKSHLLLW